VRNHVRHVALSESTGSPIAGLVAPICKAAARQAVVLTAIASLVRIHGATIANIGTEHLCVCGSIDKSRPATVEDSNRAILLLANLGHDDRGRTSILVLGTPSSAIRTIAGPPRFLRIVQVIESVNYDAHTR